MLCGSCVEPMFQFSFVQCACKVLAQVFACRPPCTDRKRLERELHQLSSPFSSTAEYSSAPCPGISELERGSLMVLCMLVKSYDVDIIYRKLCMHWPVLSTKPRCSLDQVLISQLLACSSFRVRIVHNNKSFVFFSKIQFFIIFGLCIGCHCLFYLPTCVCAYVLCFVRYVLTLCCLHYRVQSAASAESPL